jgi:hypothetical protein
MPRKKSVPRLTRRDFLKKAAGAAAAVGATAGIVSRLPAESQRSDIPVATPNSPRRGLHVAASGGMAMVRVHDHRISVETSTLSAVIEQGFLTSLKSKAGGDEFLRPYDLNRGPALQLLYRGGETAPLDPSHFGRISCLQLSPRQAQVVFHSWDGDGLLAVSADPASGDLILEPSAYSSRPGVRACRWNLPGLRQDLQLIAPFFQGVKLKLDDPLIRDSRWNWPMEWEAGLALLQGQAGGFWIHTQDDRYRYKALQVGAEADAHCLALDSEAYGPLDDNLAAGGLQWRINTYQGDWQLPAARYRDWLWRAYHLEAEERKRRDWIRNISMAVSWCPGEIEVLEALARRVDPRRVLLHFPDWRSDQYDESYPTYVASESARQFIARAQEMGFHIMPHFNAVDMDPSHPAYAQFRDFQCRDLEGKQLRGWSWYRGRGWGVPESNLARLQHRDKKVMVKIHPGLSMWRCLLGENILKAVQQLSLDTVFTDVTLCSWNLHNCLVEGLTPTEGMKRLIEHVASLGDGLVVGGEGLNEITMQGLSFAQAHLFQSWQHSIEGLERTGGCPLNDFLFGQLCRTIGYSGLSGRTPDEELRLRLHQEHNAIPTITISSADDIEHPNPAVKRVLDQAAGQKL